MGFQTTFCKTSWIPYFLCFLSLFSPLPQIECWKPFEKNFPSETQVSVTCSEFSTLIWWWGGGRGGEKLIFFQGSDSFAKIVCLKIYAGKRFVSLGAKRLSVKSCLIVFIFRLNTDHDNLIENQSAVYSSICIVRTLKCK